MKRLLGLAIVLSTILACSIAFAGGAKSLKDITKKTLTDPATGEAIIPKVIGVSSTSNKIYIGGLTTPSKHAVLAVINGTSNALTATVPLAEPATGEFITPSVLGVNETTSEVYVGGFTTSKRTVIATVNAATNALISAITLTDPATGDLIIADVLGINSATNKIYVGGYCSPSGKTALAIIDGASKSLTGTTVVVDPSNGATITARALGVTPAKNEIYIAGHATDPSTWKGYGVVAVINGDTNTVTAAIPLEATPIFPDLLGVNLVTNEVYVGGVNGYTMSSYPVLGMISRTTPPTTTIPLATMAGEYIAAKVMSVNSATSEVYLAGFTVPSDNSSYPVLATLDLTTNAVTSTIILRDPNTGESITPTVLALNSLTDKVYVGGFSGVNSDSPFLAVTH